MAARQKGADYRGFVLLSILLGTLWEAWAGQIRYSVPEETDKGSFVGNIAKDLGLEPRELAERGVRIVSRGRTQLFALNPRSGSLVTAGRIDREELCAHSARCLVSFNILMEDKMNLYPIEVEIMDVNDNAPRFLTEEMNVKIMENTAPGVRFPLNEARDPDVGTNSLQSYQLSPNHHFSLDVQTGDDGTKYPELVLERALDREEEAVHHLLLTASDGGNPLRSGIARIQVTVMDVNDHAPVFSLPQYRVTTPENVPVGTTLLTVNAVDLDDGFNGEVTYSFQKITQKILQIFQLNSLTGELSTLQGLDYEDSSFYEMEVQAQDGPGSLTRTKVLITILDVNDNAPEVTVTSLTSSVPEDTPPGTVIALFYLQDRDSGKNGEVTCAIPENLPFKLERSIDNYYRLVTMKNLDRERLSVYNITVKATDGGTPPLSSETHISIHVADTNDNPPTFSHTSYSVFVPENNPKGASIFSVTAHDPDSEENAQVIYSLAEDTIQGAPVSSYVSINSDTGVLYALRSFDYEQFQNLQLMVTACDSGDPPLSSNVWLSLFILDKNDNAPEILYPTFPTDGSTGMELTPRSAEPGYLVTKVVAVDRDSGQNAWLTYRLLKASEPGLFAVGVHTGEVRTARALQDRDALKQSLVVAVQDHGQPPLSSTVTLTVAVADSIPEVLADLSSLESPTDPDDSGLTLYLVVAVAAVSCVFLAFVIVLLALRLRRWHVSRLLQASGVGLADVTASHFVGLDGVQAFLQTYSHEVSLTADSRKSHLIFPQPNYADTLLSQESCEKNEPLLTTTDFHKCKDETPDTQDENLEVKINEITAPGTRYPLPEALDADVGVNSLQSYQLSPDPHFSLDLQTGDDGTINPELVLERSLDREEEAAHHLVLIASDGGDPRRSSTVRILVTVLDTNDNAPVFAQPVYRVKVPENVPPGTHLLTVIATDPDEGANGKVTYKFRKINEKQSPFFQLNENTGEITTANSLDYEDCSSYEMEIQAEDVGALLGRTRVLISVEDVNDNKPEVIITSLFSPVLENSLPGTVIAFLNVHDRDSGKNGQVVCYTPDNLPFKLEKSIDNYYRLLTWKYLDREEVSMYNISVMASDLGAPPLSTEIHIALHVADTNDNPPAFPHASYSAYIPENNPRGASIFSVTAQDPDSEENARVTYSLTEGTLQGAPLSSYISINSDTGVLYALQSFDYEQIQDLQLQVTASDSGNPPLSSNVSLSLFVLDQNDNAPKILYPAFPTDGSTGVELAPRSAEPGYLVTKVVAVDRDSGQNAWLSYRLLKASEPGLFAVGVHTGEVRTARALQDRDALKQSLVVAVQDHGQPPLSATVTLTVAVANSIPDILADLSTLESPANPDDSGLTLYLVVAVAAVSCVFLAFVIVLFALKLRRWHRSRLFQAAGGRLAGVPASHFVGIDGVQAFLQTYSHEVSLTADSGKSHVIFPQPNYADTLISQESCEKNDPFLTSIDFHECKDEGACVQQAPPNTDWRFSQAQRPGTSGSQNGDETGTWPNNQFDTEMLQAMILASASEAADGSSTLGGGAGTMGLSARYGPQFTLQHVPDYRQNVYIPGSNATLTNAAGKRDGKAPAGGNGNKKKSGKKEKK
ncbi:protocadherin gamma-A8 isoform X1 [Elephas maximus indicus]|uniref:protocadherin gamma-A8 isoform X1 n=1 Tax=Elephas maximus indicus TaxID=99487 RepID=UPI002116970E|nr:protocadherin gamma-A8 isoform X1 [Elephas maximus indicus]